MVANISLKQASALCNVLLGIVPGQESEATLPDRGGLAGVQPKLHVTSAASALRLHFARHLSNFLLYISDLLTSKLPFKPLSYFSFVFPLFHPQSTLKRMFSKLYKLCMYSSYKPPTSVGSTENSSH